MNSMSMGKVTDVMIVSENLFFLIGIGELLRLISSKIKFSFVKKQIRNIETITSVMERSELIILDLSQGGYKWEASFLADIKHVDLSRVLFSDSNIYFTLLCVALEVKINYLPAESSVHETYTILKENLDSVVNKIGKRMHSFKKPLSNDESNLLYLLVTGQKAEYVSRKLNISRQMISYMKNEILQKFNLPNHPQSLAKIICLYKKNTDYVI
ncbi:TPA: hypothetical protein G8S59_003999 [Salmonella enterica]|uniref:HTH luxR-type domain-containing protein n=1 Tax=Salmonella enterica TaxID=28901 RepID=A0A756YCR3_SALER|nr:hypothetical protein [Salmonella enterica]